MAGLIKGIKTLFGDVEMAPYTIVAEEEGFEIRLYPAKKWVSTTMKGVERDNLISPMFRKLFNYISGKNKPNMRIDMTTPVTTHVIPGSGPTCESTFTMAFFVPKEHQDNPPDPNDPEITIEERPDLTVLTRRFGGYATDAIVQKESRDLAELIQKSGEKDVDLEHFYVAGYDPPFKPINRRNEIWYIQTKSSNKETTEMN